MGYARIDNTSAQIRGDYWRRDNVLISREWRFVPSLIHPAVSDEQTVLLIMVLDGSLVLRRGGHRFGTLSWRQWGAFSLDAGLEVEQSATAVVYSIRLRLGIGRDVLRVTREVLDVRRRFEGLAHSLVVLVNEIFRAEVPLESPATGGYLIDSVRTMVLAQLQLYRDLRRGTPVMTTATEVLSRNFTDATFSATKLASFVGSSQAAIYREFTKAGTPPGHELTRLRLEYAEGLMRDEGAGAREAARRAGFGSLRSFQRARAVRRAQEL